MCGSLCASTERFFALRSSFRCHVIARHFTGLTPMLPSDSRTRPSGQSLCAARLQLSVLRLVRESPKFLLSLCLLLPLVVVLLLRTPAPCVDDCNCAHTLQAADVAIPTTRPSLLDASKISPRAQPLGDDEAATTMAHVVVGVMTARRFHRTRCQAQSATWLRRARRVVFFSDAAGPSLSDELQAPLIAHDFVPSSTERIFAGGNWRAVPILAAMARGFFSSKAQAAMRARGEPLPQWAFMVDDDAYVFVPQMLAALSERNPDENHYLGYAFIAAPHLEGTHLSILHLTPSYILHPTSYIPHPTSYYL